MIRVIPKCECGKLMEVIHIIFKESEHLMTLAYKEFCPDCRKVTFSKEELKLYGLIKL